MNYKRASSTYQETRADKADAFNREMYLKSGNGRRALKKLLESLRV
jgi:hypothetical protein